MSRSDLLIPAHDSAPGGRCEIVVVHTLPALADEGPLSPMPLRVAVPLPATRPKGTPEGCRRRRRE